MEQVLKKISQNLPEMAFLFFSTRLTLFGASIGDAIALVSIVAYIGYKLHLHKEKLEQSDEVKTKVEELEKAITALKMDRVLQRGQPNEQKQAPKRFF